MGNNWSSKEYVLYEVQQDGMKLKCASIALQSDLEIVAAACIQNPKAIEFASAKIKSNQTFMNELLKPPFLIRVQKDGMELESSPCSSFLNDKKIVFAAVSQNGLALEFAAKTIGDVYYVAGTGNIRANYIAMAACQQNGMALQYCSKELQDNTSIVEAAISSAMLFTADPLQFASDRLKNDTNFLIMMMLKSSFILKYVSVQLQNNKAFVLKALAIHGTAFEFVSKELQDDKEVLLKALLKDPSCVRFASERLQKKKNIQSSEKDRWIKHVKQNPRGLLKAPKHIQQDDEIIAAAKTKDASVLQGVDIPNVNDEVIISHKQNDVCCQQLWTGPPLTIKTVTENEMHNTFFVCSKWKGVVKYVGEVGYAKGKDWVGVKLNELGIGKNDGSVKGKKYFDAGDKMGLLVRANHVWKVATSHV